MCFCPIQEGSTLTSCSGDGRHSCQSLASVSSTGSTGSTGSWHAGSQRRARPPSASADGCARAHATFVHVSFVEHRVTDAQVRALLAAEDARDAKAEHMRRTLLHVARRCAGRAADATAALPATVHELCAHAAAGTTHAADTTSSNVRHAMAHQMARGARSGVVRLHSRALDIHLQC